MQVLQDRAGAGLGDGDDHFVAEDVDGVAVVAAVPEITSYGSARSSWSNVFLLLPEATAVERGDRILVLTHADLAGAVPTYRFNVALGRDEELHLGSFAYPEAPPPPGGSGEDECLVEFW